MPPPDTEPAIPPAKEDVDAVPDTVPADVPGPHDPDKPLIPEFAPPASNVDVVMPDALEVAAPAPTQGLAPAVGSNGAGLSPPGASEVAPSGIPTGPTGDAAPGIPSGDVVPIAGAFGVNGVN